MEVDHEKPSTNIPVTEIKVAPSRPQTSRARTGAVPEVDLYIHLLVLIHLLDKNQLKMVDRNFSYFSSDSIKKNDTIHYRLGPRFWEAFNRKNQRSQSSYT